MGEMELAATMAVEDGGSAADGLAALRLARTGDAAAFERLVRLYERRVFRIALRLLGNHADAQDAAQEVFCACTGTCGGSHRIATERLDLARYGERVPRRGAGAQARRGAGGVGVGCACGR